MAFNPLTFEGLFNGSTLTIGDLTPEVLMAAKTTNGIGIVSLAVLQSLFQGGGSGADLLTQSNTWQLPQTFNGSSQQVVLGGGANNSITNRNVSLSHDKTSGVLGFYDQLNAGWIFQLDTAGNGWIGGEYIHTSGNQLALGTSATTAKSALGLSNVNNTADADKPVSTAQQTALNGKGNLAGGNTWIGNQSFSGGFNVSFGSLNTTAGSAVAGLQQYFNSGNAEYLETVALRASDGTGWGSTTLRVRRRVDSTQLSYFDFGGNDASKPMWEIGALGTWHLRVDAGGNKLKSSLMFSAPNIEANANTYLYADGNDSLLRAGLNTGSTFGYFRFGSDGTYTSAGYIADGAAGRWAYRGAVGGNSVFGVWVDADNVSLQNNNGGWNKSGITLNKDGTIAVSATTSTFTGNVIASSVKLSNTLGLDYSVGGNRLLIRSESGSTGGNVSIDAVNADNSAFDILRFRGTGIRFNNVELPRTDRINTWTQQQVFSGMTDPIRVINGTGILRLFNVGSRFGFYDETNGNDAMSYSFSDKGMTFPRDVYIGQNLVVTSNPYWMNTGLQYHQHATSHVAYIKKTGSYNFYWRRSDTGMADGANTIELMKLDDTGRLTTTGGVTTAGAGDAYASAAVQLVGSYGGGICFNDGNQIMMRTNGSGATLEWLFSQAGGAMMSVTSAGQLWTAGAMTPSGGFQPGSSRELKNLIRPNTYGLKEVLQLSTHLGTYHEWFNPDGRKRIFQIAEEIQAVMPELTDGPGVEATPPNGIKRNFLGYSLEQLSAVHTQAFHDTYALIEKQTEEIQQLKEAVAQLQEQRA